jgi:uncharacterized protein (DUF488 family)
MNRPVFTIGHSNRSIEEFTDLLRTHRIERLVDVRTIPRSRHNPQFDQEGLCRTLQAGRIGCRHMRSLGGLRHPRPHSPNTGWRNPSFRGFADYLQTPRFEAALEELISFAGEETTAIMCAEAVPWRCHRSLIADALTVRGIEVRHILGPGETRPHRLTPFALVRGTEITYPPEQPDLPMGDRERDPSGA